MNTPNADPSLRAADQAAGGLPEGLPRRRPDEDGDAADQDRRPRVLQRRRQAASRSTRASTASRSARRARTPTSSVQDTITVSGNLTPKPSVADREAAGVGRPTTRAASRSACMFPENVDIDPGLTVAMNDDSLVRLDRARQEQAVPGGDDVQLLERPAGRRLGRAAGKIHTVANGAATVTATATYNGESASTKFVVRVLSDLELDLVRRDAGAGLPARRLELQRDRPAGRHRRRPVTATAPSADGGDHAGDRRAGHGDDHLDRARGHRRDLHGQLRAGGDERRVRRRHARPEVDGRAAEREPRDRRRLADDHARGRTADDEQRDDGEEPRARSRRSATSRTTTKVTFNQKPNAATQQAGLLVYQDDDNYLKFDLEATSATNAPVQHHARGHAEQQPGRERQPDPGQQTLNTTSAPTRSGRRTTRSGCGCSRKGNALHDVVLARRHDVDDGVVDTARR